MDCDALHSDIDRLKSLRDTLEASLAQATETGHGKSSVLFAQSEASTATDQILEKYLPDFIERNPELTTIQLGNRIEGFVDRDGYDANIYSTSSLPDGSVLVGGEYGALHRYYQDRSSGDWQLGPLIEGFVDRYGYDTNIYSTSSLPDGSVLIGGSSGILRRYYQDRSSGDWQLGPLIEGFVDRYGYVANIYSTSHLPDDTVLIAGSRGTLHRYYQDRSSGDWQLGPLIEGFVDRDGNDAEICSISSLPDGTVLIGGSSGTLRRCYQDRSSGDWQLGPLIEGFTDKNNVVFANINSISPLPDGTVLIGGDYGVLSICYHFQHRSSGDWQLVQLIEGFVDVHGYDANIDSISPLPDGSVLIGGSSGTLRRCYQDRSSGDWQLGPLIEGFVDIYGFDANIYSTSRLPDDTILIGGGRALYQAIQPTLPVSTLKQHLDQIIAKNNLNLSHGDQYGL